MSVLMGEGPQMNNFEQVSSDGNQMSPGGSMSDIKGGGAGPLGPMSDVQGGKDLCQGCQGTGGLYNEVQCIMGNGHMSGSQV